MYRYASLHLPPCWSDSVSPPQLILLVYPRSFLVGGLGLAQQDPDFWTTRRRAARQLLLFIYVFISLKHGRDWSVFTPGEFGVSTRSGKRPHRGGVGIWIEAARVTLIFFEGISKIRLRS